MAFTLSNKQRISLEKTAGSGPTTISLGVSWDCGHTADDLACRAAQAVRG